MFRNPKAKGRREAIETKAIHSMTTEFCEAVKEGCDGEELLVTFLSFFTRRTDFLPPATAKELIAVLLQKIQTHDKINTKPPVTI